jgi:hypothetical protein
MDISNERILYAALREEMGRQVLDLTDRIAQARLDNLMLQGENQSLRKEVARLSDMLEAGTHAK